MKVPEFSPAGSQFLIFMVLQHFAARIFKYFRCVNRLGVPGRKCRFGKPKSVFIGREKIGWSWPVSRILSWIVIPLGVSLPDAQATYPQATRATSLPAYLVLLQMEFTVPSVLPRPRWALTPPFHHRRFLAELRQTILCGTVHHLTVSGR